jgi:hypothetical protein
MKRDYTTRKVLAYVLAPHEDAAFLELKALLKPFGIVQFFTLWLGSISATFG